MVEWSNPIFYINFGGFLLATFAFVKLRGLAKEGKSDSAWTPYLGIIAVGTRIHSLGDLINYPDAIENISSTDVITAPPAARDAYPVSHA